MDIKRNEKVDVAAKKGTGWRRVKKRNGKWKKWDSGHIAEKQALKRARATMELALEQRTLGLWEKTWLSKKTGRELHAICPKPTKNAKIT